MKAPSVSQQPYTVPASLAEGSCNNWSVSLTYRPTLLDAAGIPVPEEMQGRSILPLTRGETEGWPEEVFVQVSESQVGRAVRTHRWKYGVAAPGGRGAQGAGSEQYIEESLYDLQADPYELTKPDWTGIASAGRYGNARSSYPPYG